VVTERTEKVAKSTIAGDAPLAIVPPASPSTGGLSEELRRRRASWKVEQEE
jgi:hypothetical protein